MKISTAERIETIVLRRQSGVFGVYECVEDSPGECVVTLSDGRAFTVRRDRGGYWTVRAGSIGGVAQSLLDAARNCLFAFP